MCVALSKNREKIHRNTSRHVMIIINIQKQKSEPSFFVWSYQIRYLLKSHDYIRNKEQEIQQIMKNKITWRRFVSAASTIPSKDDK